MERVTQEHRDTVRAGNTVRIGGYTASTTDELDLLERKFGKGQVSEEEVGDGKPPTEAQMNRFGLERLRTLATQDGVTFADTDEKPALIRAILEKRPPE